MIKISIILSLLYLGTSDALAGVVVHPGPDHSLRPVKIVGREFLNSFTSFTAERKEGTCYLNWIPGNGQAADHFDIQRSYDAVDFITIGSLSAKDNGKTGGYRFADHSPLTGFAWYRLRSVDMEGKFNYSKIEMVSETVIPAGSFVVVSSVRDAISILNNTGHEGEFRYSVTNSAGQTIIKGMVNMKSNGAAILSLPKSVISGMYVLHIADDRIRFRRRILIEN